MSKCSCCVRVLPTQLLLSLLLLCLGVVPECAALTTGQRLQQRRAARARTHRTGRRHAEVSTVYLGNAAALSSSDADAPAEVSEVVVERKRKRRAAMSLMQQQAEEGDVEVGRQDPEAAEDTAEAERKVAEAHATSTTGQPNPVPMTGCVDCPPAGALGAAPGAAPAASPAAAPMSAPAPAAAVALTTLEKTAMRGDASIEVASQSGFNVGDVVRIGEESTLVYETRKIIGYGSLILDSPLLNSYPANTVVIVVPGAEATQMTLTVDHEAGVLTKETPMELEVLNPVVEPAESKAEATQLEEMNDMLDAERKAMDPSDPCSKYKEELAAVEWLQDRLTEKENDLKEENYRAKIAAAQAVLEKETSPGTARMLGDMRREMHTLAAPFFTKVLHRQLRSLEHRKKVLLAKIEGGGVQKVQEERSEKKAEEVVDDEPLLDMSDAEDTVGATHDIFEAHYKLIIYTLVILALLMGGACGLLHRRRGLNADA